MKITLKNPIKIDGKNVKELDLKLDDLTGADLAAAEREYQINGGIPTSLTTSIIYAQGVAARAAGVDLGDIQRLKLQDCNAVCIGVQSFLYGTESSEPEILKGSV